MPFNSLPRLRTLGRLTGQLQVKTNVGHSEGSSGLTSILKVVKSFEHGVIGPSRGVTRLNPKRKHKLHNAVCFQKF